MTESTNDGLAITRLTLIRHGETSWNQGARIQGHTDIELNANGHAQAARMAASLADSHLEQIYSSDLARALQTAQALQVTTTCALQTHRGLRERCFGILEGKTLAEMEAQDPQLAHAFQTRDPHYVPPNGESMLMFQARVLETLHHIAAAHTGQHIALVTHGGVLDILYRYATDLDLQTPRTWTIDNTSVHRMLCTHDSLGLLAWGDVSHLEEPSVAFAGDDVAGDDTTTKATTPAPAGQHV